MMAAVCLTGTAAFAVRTESVVHQGLEQWLKGKFEGVGITHDGKIFPSPGLRSVASVSSPIIWQARPMSDGALVVTTGNNGTVYRIDPDGTETVLFQPEEALSRALLVDDADQIYVGTSPRGRVYRLLAGGTIEVFFDPSDAYIWDMKLGPDGLLYVATGGKAKVYRIPLFYRFGDAAEVVFEGSESHVNQIAFDREGNLIVGTGPGGTLYRVDKPGSAYALYSSGAEEIRCLIPAEDGSVYFGSFSARKAGAGEASVSVAGAEGGEEINPFQMTVHAGPSAELNGLFRLTPGGFVEKVWSLEPNRVFSAARKRDGRWLIGSGTDGRLFRTEGDIAWSNLLALPAGGEITHILPVPGEDEQYYIISSNPGRIHVLEDSSAEASTYTSQVIDVGRMVEWGALRHLSTRGVFDNHVQVSTRAGNVSDPNRSWSDWLPLEEGRIASPHARFLQYQLVLASENPGIQRVQVFYQEQNLPPNIGEIRILPGAYRLFSAPRPAQNVNLSNVLRSGADATRIAGPQRIPQLVIEKEEGAVTAVWGSSDPNGDRLLFDLFLRQVGHPDWVTVVAGLSDPVFAMDIRGLNEGYYQVKVDASDHLDNAEGKGLSFERESEPFLIDFTSPQVVLESLEIASGRAVARIRVSDQFGVICNAFYSVNGEQMFRSLPDDGIYDQTTEFFTVEFDLLPGRSNSLVFQAYDENDNVGLLTRSIPAVQDP